jgi:Predicted membrane protein
METEIKKETKKKKKWWEIHVYTLLVALICVAGIMTYVIPAGTFDRQDVNGASVVVAGTFHYIKQQPVNILGWFTAIGQGFVDSASIICGVFIFVAGIGMYMEADIFNKAIFKAIKKIGNTGEKAISIILMAFFAVLGGFTGNITPELAFVPMTIGLALAFGYDTMTGVLMVLFPTFVGFATGPLNPYTVYVAQSIAQLPSFSGMLPRTICWTVMSIISMWFVFRYGAKVKKDRNNALGDFDASAASKDELTAKYADIKLTTRDWLLLIGFIGTVVWMILGAAVFNYELNQYTAIFIISGIYAGIVAGFSETKICQLFIKYGQSLYFGAMCIALARAIYVIFTKGSICDTVVYALSQPLQHLPSTLCAVGMLIFQTILNFFVNSGSGQAMVSMPIMAPLSDLLGVTRQTAVSAFQFGDGLSNLIWPTSSTIFAYLAMANLKYDKYMKVAMPLFLILSALAVVFVLVAQLAAYGPF